MFIISASRTALVDNVIRYNAENGVFVRGGLGSDDTMIRGNLISGNTKIGIWISGYDGSASRTIIQGNLIGTDPTGTMADGNRQHGIYYSNASYALIGGTDPADRNVISGNLWVGLYINGVEIPTQFNVVQGNYIGVDITGTQPLGNGYGFSIPSPGLILFQNAQFNTIGGTEPGAGNVIGGNYSHGLFIGGNGGVTNNVVQGNFIGTDVTGTLDLGNAFSGIVVADSAANNTIGGLEPGAGNVIAFNDGTGIFAGQDLGNLLPQTGNAFLSNLIYSNGFGIDLGPDNGPTINDSFGHVGPNNYQNYPIVTSASSVGGVLIVRGTLSSTPNTAFTVQFFISDTADQSGFGEGQRLLGTITVTTDANGSVAFEQVLGTAFALGEVVTATATDPAGNTSEFSEARTVLLGNEPPIVTVPVTGPTVLEGGTVAVEGIERQRRRRGDG